MIRESSPFKQLTIYEEMNQPAAWTKLVQSDGRVVWAPNETMAIEQEAIFAELNYLGIEFKHATAVAGSDFVRNAIIHSGNNHFFTLDFKSAYSQVDIAALAEKLHAYGFQAPTPDPGHIYERLISYCTPPEGTGLVQGGSSSPMLFNIYCLDLDTELGDFCQSHDITYTRYLDDMTFSMQDSGFATHSRIGKGTRKAIREIIAGHNLQLNESKTRVRDLNDRPVKVTGVQINTRGRIQMPTNYLRQKRRELQYLVSTAPQDEVVSFASGLNGLLKQTDQGKRKLSKDELALLTDVHDILYTHRFF